MAFSLGSSRHNNNNHQPLVKNSPRKRTNFSSLSPSVNDALQTKCAKELNKLRSNCRKTLQQDLTRLLDEETFTDTFIEGDTFRKPCHSCLLASRVPLFYSHLVNYFDSTVTKRSKRGYYCYRLPPSIDCKEITDFLKEVYCHEDIGSEESSIIDKLQAYISMNMTSESGIDKKSLSSSGDAEACGGNDNHQPNGLIKEDSLEDFKQAGKGDTGFDKDSLKPADSLELVTDSLNNEQLSSEENKNDHQSTDYEDSLAAGQKDHDDNNGLTSSGSSQMVRSGTFDMLSSIPLEDQPKNETKELINDHYDFNQNDDGDSDENQRGEDVLIPSSANNLRHRIDSLELDLSQAKDVSTKDSLDDENEDLATDGDVVTPIAEAPESLNTRSQSSSLFQFFVDIDSMSSSMPNCKSNGKEEKSNNMTSSGFMFIDLNSVGTSEEQQKSRTIERDKNKAKDKRVPQIDPQEERAMIKSNSSLSMKLSSSSRTDRFRSSQSEDMNIKEKSINTNKISNDVSPGKPMNYRRQTSCSSGLRRTSNDCHSLQVKSRAKSTNRHASSPMSSMDSGMLSSLNSENTHGINDEDWLQGIKSNQSRSIKSTSVWQDGDTHEDQYNVRRASSRQNYRQQRKEEQISTESEPLFNDDDTVNKNNNETLRRTINSCSKLGEDLLQMFFNEINADITIKAENRSLKAHKCILVARSPYFSAMFSGEWRDSKTSNITLQGFSYATVHFALCHIYSGALNIPSDDINLAELALLSNLLALDTLRDVVIYELEKSYCHFFHKPCSECVIGVVDCLIVSSECGFSTLQQKCLTWSGKHFARLWPTRTFACLPSSLLNQCFQSTVHSITPKSIIEIMLNCDRLTKTTPKVKWAEPIFSLIGRLIEQCVNFVAGNYDLIVTSDSFFSLGRSNSWNISALEESFIAAMNNLTPDVACKTLVKLNNIISIAENEEAFGYGPYAEPYVALVRKMYRHCERFLVQNVNQAVAAPNWSLIPSEVQQKIKDSAIIVFEFDKPIAPRPHLSSSQLQSLRKKRSSESSESNTKPSSSSPSINHKSSAHRSRLRNNDSRRQASLNRSSSDHIYDEVTLESGDYGSGATSLPVDSLVKDHHRHRHHRSSGRNSRNGLSSSSHSANNNNHNLDSDFADSLSSSLNENYNGGAVKHSENNRRKSPQSTPVRSNNSNFRPSSRPRTNSSSSTSRSLASRPPFK